jgi:hypothetical protein
MIRQKVIRFTTRTRLARALLLIPLALAVSPAMPAQAATLTLNDASSCSALGGTEFIDGQCRFYGHASLNVAAGDVLNVSVPVAAGGLTNDGTINLTNGMFLWTFSSATNNGTINLVSGTSINNMQGTFTNNGTITVPCGASVSGITGNAPQTSDCTPPKASPTQSPAANANGWNNSDVTVTWNWSDTGGPGIDPANCPTSSTSSGEGTMQLSASCTDVKGLQGSASYTVQVDKTPPQTSAVASPLPNTAGWNNSNVTVTLNATEKLSGIDHTEYKLDAGGWTTYNGTVSITSEGKHVLQYRSVDVAGNVESAQQLPINIDKTAPTLTFGTPSPAPNASGWNNTNVSIPCTPADAVSGVATVTPACPLTLSTEGAVATSTVTVTDLAGNTATFTSPAFMIDKTPPTISAAAATPPNGNNGWYTSPVTVDFSCTDALSGVATCPSPQTLSSDGSAVSSTAQTAADKAGNTSAASNVMTVKIDKTPPAVTYTGNAGSYTVDQQVQISCTATDATSGVASSTCQNISGPAYSFGLGTHSYSATATDIAGNVGHGLTSFTVTFNSSSLQSLINRFCTDPSVAASLDQDVDSIAHAQNANAKAGMLQGFTQLVQAQTGKSLTSDQAKVLITLAAAL